jgi:hypothetical protein
MDEPAQQPPTSSVAGVPTPESPPLTYEETPVIENVESEIPKQPEALHPPQPPTVKRSGSCLKIIGIIVLVIVLFIGGIWISSFVRQFLPAGQNSPSSTTLSEITPTASVSADSYAPWKSYDVISGITKQPIAGLMFKLPSNVLSPICDGASCVSQGTYLPGGSRLTVAPRGAGLSLRDFRGTVITDANGIPIPTKPLLLGSINATEYESSGSGQTVSGYAYSHIRGVMIPITDTLSVEVNHFVPSGINADFSADDTLFDSIVKTFTFTATTSEEKGMPPPTATTSGH